MTEPPTFHIAFGYWLLEASPALNVLSFWQIMAYLSRNGRRRWMRRIKDWGVFVHLRDLSAAAFSTNPCRVNEGALLDLKARADATTHARRCPKCCCPLYRDELCCPLCNHERAWAVIKTLPDTAKN